MLTYQYTLLTIECYAFLPDSRRVVYALTGDFAFTFRASSTNKWLRRVPVRRGLVRFLGFPKVLTPRQNKYLLNVTAIIAKTPTLTQYP